MARTLALKTATLDHPMGPQEFAYGKTMLDILRFEPSGQGMTLEEMGQRLDAVAPIKSAIEAGSAEVTLTDGQWQTLRDKLASYRWTFADSVIAEFGAMIQLAPEIGTEMPAPAGEAARPRRVS